MYSLRALGLLGCALLVAPAIAQTTPPHKRPAPTSAHAARPPRPANDNGKGQADYAAPGEPINVQDNGRNTPPYDGPAAGHEATPKGLKPPRKPQHP